MSITSFLNSRGFYAFEGHTQLCPQKVIDLINLTNKPHINIMETQIYEEYLIFPNLFFDIFLW